MLRTWRTSLRLFSDFNNFQFAGVFGMVLFVVLLLFMTDGSHYHHSTSVDLPKVGHAVSMPSANREDAMIVNITRDGRTYFGSEQVDPADLPQKIGERLQDRSVERKIYVKADMRARWSSVKPVLDGVRAAGILRVAFLTHQRQSGPLHL